MIVIQIKKVHLLNQILSKILDKKSKKSSLNKYLSRRKKSNK